MTGVKVGKGVGEAAIVAVGDSGPVMGIPGWAVWVSAAALVPAMAVSIAFGSSGVAPGGAQAWTTIDNTETSRTFRVVFNMLPSFGQRR